MCGRLNGGKPEPGDIPEFLDLDLPDFEIHPKEIANSKKEIIHNICPTDYCYVYYHDQKLDKYRLTKMQFGLIPWWSDGDLKTVKRQFTKTINARVETIFEKKSYNRLIKNKRCIILVEGWNEWVDSDEPYYIHSKINKFIGFAGVWDRWKVLDGYKSLTGKPTGEVITSCSVITTEPGKYIGQFHDRSPRILFPKDWQAFINPKMKVNADILSFLTPFEDIHSELEAYQVDPKKINNVRYKESDVNDPIAEAVPSIA